MENYLNNNPNYINGFKKVFLRSSARKLFLLLIIVPCVGQFIITSVIVLTVDPELAFMIIPLIMLPIMALFLGWYYTLGTSLYSKLPQDNNMNIKLFKFNLIFASVYIIIFDFIFISNIINFGVLFLFHLYATYAIFYGLYFITKTLVSVERQQIVKFGSCLDVFFMLWFFPIGIWFLQPRIRKIFI